MSQTVFNEIRNIKQVEYEAEAYFGPYCGKKKVDMVTKGGVKVYIHILFYLE